MTESHVDSFVLKLNLEMYYDVTTFAVVLERASQNNLKSHTLYLCNV